jgi:hypothetical protein
MEKRVQIMGPTSIFTTPHGVPPSLDVHDHSIPLALGILPPNVHPYHHPFS